MLGFLGRRNPEERNGDPPTTFVSSQDFRPSLLPDIKSQSRIKEALSREEEKKTKGLGTEAKRLLHFGTSRESWIVVFPTLFEINFAAQFSMEGKTSVKCPLGL